MAEEHPKQSDVDQQQDTDENLQVIELGRGETSEDNQLQPFAGNWSIEDLQKVAQGSKVNVFKFELSQTTKNITNVSGDVVQGKFDIKDAQHIGKIGVGKNPTPIPQEMQETENQRYIDAARDYEEPTSPSEENAQIQRRTSGTPGGARRKTRNPYHPSPRHSSNKTDVGFHQMRRDLGQMQLAEYDDDAEENPTLEELRSPAFYKQVKFAQTLEPLMIDSGSQTESTRTRTIMAQTDRKMNFDTEMQTDEIITRDRMLQTDPRVMMDSDSQTSTQRSYDHHMRSSSLQVDAYSQTIKAVSSETDVQTDNLELSTSQTQTVIKQYQVNEVQTENVETATAHVQTSANVESALNMIKLFNNENTKLNIEKFHSLLTIIWKSIQLKIIMTPQEIGFKDEVEFGNEYEERIISKFIGQREKVFELGKKFKTENNYIHAIISFYAAAKLHKLNNNEKDSMFGISNCVLELRNTVRIMTEQLDLRKLVRDFLIVILFEVKNFLFTIKNIKHKNLVKHEASCLFNIGRCYSYCNEYQPCVNMNLNAIELLRKQFKDEAEKHKYYGRCLNNAGVGFDEMGKTEKAVEYFEMALEAHKKATDWDNDVQKDKSIALAKSNLKKAKERLREQI